MLIDKSKFLVLVAAISASQAACVIVDGDGEGGEGGEGGSAQGGRDQGGSDQGGGGQGGTAQGGGGQGGTAQGGGGQGGAGGGAACLDDVGTPDACSSECEGGTNCNVVDELKAGVAEQVVACLNGLDPVACSFYFDAVQGCLVPGLDAACADPVVATPCSNLAASCSLVDDDAWQAECSSRLSGLSESGREIVTGCFLNVCGAGLTLDDCMVDLFF